MNLSDESLEHHSTFKDIFCNQFLHCSLNLWSHSSDYDDVVILEEFDSDKSMQRWFIYNLNVKCALNSKELLATISHKIFLASQENNTW